MRNWRRSLSLGVLLLASPTVGNAQATPARADPATAIRLQNSANEITAETPPDPEETAIIVRGKLERKSAWKRAEGEHAIVYSNGSEVDLRHVSAMLDREFAALRAVFGPGKGEGKIAPPTVVLIGGNNFDRILHLANLRSDEGPYARPFRFQRHYDPRISGSMIAVGRSDQFIPVAAEALATDPFADPDESDAGAEYDDAFDSDPIAASSGKLLRRPLKRPHVDRAWQELVYSAFAQDYVLSHFPASYPRWYLDGIGALFSTLSVGADGTIEYGRTPANFAAVYNSTPVVAASDVLASESLHARRPDWTPYQAWVLAHYFVLRETSAEQHKAFSDYLRAISRGEPAEQAIHRLGPAAELDSDVKQYAEGPTWFYSLPDPGRREPLISALSPGEAELLKARVEFGSRLDPALREDNQSIRRRDAYLADLRSLATKRMPSRTDAMALLAEASCAAARIDECAASAGQLLQLDPGDSRGLAWRAMALTKRAIAQPENGRAAANDAALRAIIAANTADREALVPLLAYFQLYQETGRTPPKTAMLGMMKIVEAAPAAAAPRLALGRALVAQGYTDEGRRILAPIAFAGYSTPEQDEAARILAQITPPAN